jgi:hypothetical protein
MYSVYLKCGNEVRMSEPHRGRAMGFISEQTLYINQRVMLVCEKRRHAKLQRRQGTTARVAVNLHLRGGAEFVNESG